MLATEQRITSDMLGQKMKVVVIITDLLLLHLPCLFSAENVGLISPNNAICACIGETLNYTCTIAVDTTSTTGSTLWKGSAFKCAGDEISLIHDQFVDGTSGECNGGDIVARSAGVEEMRYTSELDVRISAELNGKTVNCLWDVRPQEIARSTITVATACGEPQPVVNLTEVSPGQLKFMWTQLHSGCSAVQYHITSDCGNCSLSGDISAICSNLQPSEIERNCSISVMSMTRGFNGTPSNPIMIMLKVPGAPLVDFTPVYSAANNTLIKLIAEITLMDNFSIYEGISGAVENYVAHFSSGDYSTTSANSNCRYTICEHMIKVPRSVCQSSNNDNAVVNVLAVNRLGPGRASEPVSLECTNRVIMVNINSAASTLSCRFLNPNQSSVEKTCSVEYRLCNQQQVITAERNSTSDRVTLRLRSGSNCYTYRVVASDGTTTVVVEGRIDGGKSSSSTIIAIVVPIFTVAVLVAVLLVVYICKKCYGSKCKKNVYRPGQDTTDQDIIEVVKYRTHSNQDLVPPIATVTATDGDDVKDYDTNTIDEYRTISIHAQV